jgi:hypothetical protein
LASLGVAALVAASPILFETLRWCGVAYLAYLAIRMIRSAIGGESISLNPNAPPASLTKGFITSFFNPKGLLVYLAILPNFMNATEGIAQQAVLLRESSSVSARLSTVPSASSWLPSAVSAPSERHISGSSKGLREVCWLSLPSTWRVARLGREDVIGVAGNSRCYIYARPLRANCRAAASFSFCFSQRAFSS